MARERYLLGAGEDTIHSGVIELKTAKDKRANWWFYHKNHLIIGIIMTIVVGSLIYSIVFIFLKFPWAEQYHVSGIDNRVVIRIVKMEVGASRGNIDDLEVQSPSGTVGWQFRVRGQTIGSTASHDQRPAFVFKIQKRMVSVA